ncbi:J domain-containing protein [Falsiroseomonas selenitidurans]|uniref:J domain-containing protein n=1 Tax=Falsiroseomonas selenitidurans TaxID=2716335 RepID=A0ABX1EBD5_9PROT|nr:J domain-containing protein [Falsiroseomonas selenitidurans]NKC34544.1 J domain-containing protein [Falsiroseomonas selenitidurans]
MTARQRLLGFAPAAGAEELRDRLAALPGPPMELLPLGPVAALLQAAEPPARALLLAKDRAGLLRQLAALQRRLEAACLSGPFLPADPGAATLPEATWPALLPAQAAAAARALACHGGTHQWDVILRWSPEALLTAQRGRLEGLGRAAMAEAVGAILAQARTLRQAALLQALAPRVLAVAEAAPVAEDAAIGATVRVPAGGEAAIEAALFAMPAALTQEVAADLRGPLPPLAFAAARVAEVPADAIDRAWSLLELPEVVAPAELHRRWRGLAGRLHPDQAGQAADPGRFAEAAEAYRLLRGLAGGATAVRRATLTRSPACHLLLPEPL